MLATLALLAPAAQAGPDLAFVTSYGRTSCGTHEITIHNYGDVEAENFYVDIYKQSTKPRVGQFGSDSVFIPSLPAGTSLWLWLDASYYSGTIWMQIDPDQWVSESSESNNWRRDSASNSGFGPCSYISCDWAFQDWYWDCT